MSYVPSIWIFGAATLLIALSPGPNVMLVVSHALRAGFAPALAAIFGLALAPLVYLGLSVLGLTLLFQTWPGLLLAVRAAGVGYLLWIAVRMLWCLRQPIPLQAPTPIAAGSAVVHGFATSFSNPKTLLYFTAFLPQFLDPERPIIVQLVTLAAIGMLIEVVVLLGYAAVATGMRRFAAGIRFRRIVDAAAALLLLGLGMYLALDVAQIGLARAH